MIPEKLKEIREATGMNKKEFANYIGLKYTTYNNYETGTREPASDFLILISEKFDVSIDYILGLKEEKDVIHSYELKANEYDHIKKYRSLDDRGKKNVDTLLDNEYEYLLSIQDQPQDTEHAYMIHENRLYMTSYDYGASAGTGNYLDEWDIPKSTISVPDTPETRKADFVLRVVGDSMEPDYHDGDRVLVKSQDSVNLNDIAIYIIDGESYIKQYRGSYLHSLNPAYDDIQMNDGQVIKCVGKVLGKL